MPIQRTERASTADRTRRVLEKKLEPHRCAAVGSRCRTPALEHDAGGGKLDCVTVRCDDSVVDQHGEIGAAAQRRCSAADPIPVAWPGANLDRARSCPGPKPTRVKPPSPCSLGVQVTCQSGYARSEAGHKSSNVQRIRDTGDASRDAARLR